MKKIPEFLSSRINISDDNICWPWTGITDNLNYGIVSYDGNNRKAHRIVYKYAVDENIKGFVIRHKCDNPICCNPNHLIKGSHSDNVKDRVERNRSASGIKNGRSKLTEEQVKEIFLNKNTMRISLAKRYGVDLKVIRDIKNRIKWKEVTASLAE